MKSGDTGPVSQTAPPTVLITTPESTDSLLTRAPRLFTTLSALVLDEIHLFDNSPRGDHVRCLLRRIETIQAYHQQQAGINPFIGFQRVALSATVPDPAGVASRYLTAAAPDEKAAVEIVEAPGGRQLLADMMPIRGLDDLVTALAFRMTGDSAIRKALLFCNTRNEVEQVAAYLRQHLPYEAAIFVHYSNLDPALRLETETNFAQAGVAICVSSSTLELGIDIGTIDDVVLIGPPPTLSSFLQRIGRGGRRRTLTHVLCLPRSPLEEIRFHALLDVAQTGSNIGSNAGQVARAFAPAYHFRPSVLVQQIFSLLKQSPTGAIRLADLRRITPVTMDDEALRSICAQLATLGYLQGGRPGEWRPGPALNDLIDENEIYSNIGAELLPVVIVDAYSGRTIAQTGRIRIEGETLLMGGRRLEVVWRDRYRIGVRPVPDAPVDEELRFQPRLLRFRWR